MWATDVKEILSTPELAEALEDPERVGNQDESSLYVGDDHQVVLAPVGYDGPIQVQGGDTRDRVSASVMGNAAGTWTDVRLVFKGVRHRDGQLEDLPTDGLTGRWKTCASERGFVNREIFLLILKDLAKHLDDKKIKRPFILFIDGYKGHLGLKISLFCKENGIQLILFKPNSTHLCQPLDLVFFKSVKQKMKKRSESWHGKHVGQKMGKYVMIKECAYPAFEETVADPENIKAGFRRAGLVPWDPTVLDKRKLVPSSIFQRETAAVEDVEVVEDVQGDISANFDCPALVSLTPRTGPGRNIILIQEKVTSIGAEVGPGGVTLPGLLPQHCTIHRTEEGPVTITPCTHHGDITALVKDITTLFLELNAFSLQVVINSKMIKETTILQSGIDFKIGTDMFRFVDNLEKRQTSLSEAGEVVVEEELGLRTGSSSYNVAWGGDKDTRQLEMDHVHTNISARVEEISFRMATCSEVEEMLDELSEDLESQLARLGLVGKILTLKLMVRATEAPEENVKYNGLSMCDNLSQSVTLASATCSHRVISKEVTTLMKTMGTKPGDLRGIGITVSKLERKWLEQQGEATVGDLVSKSLGVLQRDHVESNINAEVLDGVSFHTGSEVLVFITELSEDLESQLARLGLVGNTLTLKLMVRAADAPVETAKYNGHSDTVSRSVTLDSATCCHRVICREVASLVKTMRAKPSNIRGIGISVSKLERSSWRGMRTVGEIKRDANIRNSVDKDSLYKKVEREAKVFKPLQVPRNLQADLPYSFKPKVVSKGQDLNKDRVAVVLDHKERKIQRKFENATTDVDKSQTPEQDAAAADVLMLAKSLKTEQEQMNLNDKRKQVKQFECMLNIEDEKRVQKFEKLRAAGLSADQVRGNWKYYDQINDLMF